MVEIKDPDINALLFPFLDPAMLAKLLDFHAERKHYDEARLLKIKANALAQTYLLEEMKEAKVETTKVEGKAAELKSKRVELEKTLGKVLNALRSSEIKDEKEWAAQVKADAEVDDNMLDGLFKYAKLLFDCGEYQKAEIALTLVRRLWGGSEKSVNALWGLLGCEIMLGNKDKAREVFDRLKDRIDTLSSPIQQQNSRAWLLHWRLFVGVDQRLVQLAEDQSYALTVELLCPHLIRYLLAAAISTKASDAIRTVANIVHASEHRYRDPFLEFVVVITRSFSFERVPKLLREIAAEVDKDYFMHAGKEGLMRGLQELVVAIQGAIYQVLEIERVAKTLEVSEERALEIVQGTLVDGTLSADKKKYRIPEAKASPLSRIEECARELEKRSLALHDQLKPPEQVSAQFFCGFHSLRD